MNCDQTLRERNVFRLCSMQKDRYGEPFLRQKREEFVTMAWWLGVYDRIDRRLPSGLRFPVKGTKDFDFYERIREPIGT